MSVSSPETRAVPSMPDGAALLAESDPEVALEVKGLVKEYPGTRALDGVDIQIRRGEIHALLGENGAGKTTLIRSICGASRPTEGQIYIEGRPVELNSPQQAQDLGIAVVHQHFNLVPQLSVAENLFLSQVLPHRVGLFVNWSATEKRARKLLDRVGLEDRPVDRGQQAETRRERDGRDRQGDRQRRANHHPGRANLGTIARRSVDAVRAYAAARHGGTCFSLCEPPLGGSVRNRRSRYGTARRPQGRRLDARGDVAQDHHQGHRRRRQALDRRYEQWAGRSRRARHGRRRSGGRTGSGSQLRVALGRDSRLCRAARQRRRGGAGSSVRPVSRPERPADGARKARHASLPARRQERGHGAVPKNRHAESLLPGASVRENISLPNLSRFVTDPVLRFIRRGRERAESQRIATRLAIKMPSIEASINSLERRQSAKGDSRPLAGQRREDIHAQLPDRRGRHRRQGGHLRSHPPDRRIRRGRHLHFDRGRGVSARLPASDRVPRRRVAGELAGANATEANIMHLAVGGEDER